MNHLKYLLTLFFVFLCALAYPQREIISFNAYTIEDGLSQSRVNAIYQDNEGFLWFGTDDGLNRFDGYEFMVFKYNYKDSLSISNNQITSITEDAKGNIWIGTFGGGLNRFDHKKGTFERFTFHDETDDASLHRFINYLYCDEEGVLWVGTDGAGLIKIGAENEEHIHYIHDEDDPTTISGDFIDFILEDEQGRLVVGTRNAGISIMQPNGTFKHIQLNKDFNRCFSSYKDEHGDIYVGSLDGLYRFNGNMENPVQLVDDQENDPDDQIVPNAIIDLPGNNMMIGNLVSGLYMFSKKTGALKRIDMEVNTPDINSSNFSGINNIFTDRSGIIWVGTNGQGILNFDPDNPFKLYRNIEGVNYSLTSNSVRDIIEDRHGRLWVASYGGLSVFDNKIDSAYHFEVNSKKKETFLMNQATYSLLEDSRGHIWIGLEGLGVQVYNPETKHFVSYHSPFGDTSRYTLNGETITAIFEDSDERIWIGTDEGLELYLPEKNGFKHFLQYVDKRAGIQVLDVEEDAHGYLWVATELGLYYMNPETYEMQSFHAKEGDQNSLSSSRLKCVYVDDNDVIWIGTNGGGLCRLSYTFRDGMAHDVSIQRIGVDDGLSNNVIYGILEDEQNRLWMSTNYGINCYDKNTGEIRYFVDDDGLQSNEFNTKSYLKRDDAQMYFGGINGLNAFYPDQVELNTTPPPVVLTDFKVLGQHHPQAKEINFTGRIELQPNENFFSFEFAALDFSAPAKNQYAYKLEGFHDDWIYSGSRRYVSFSSLRPGTYTFRVKAANNDGVWNEEGKAVKIVILPPYWRTPWFISLMILLALGIIVYIFFLRTRALRNKQRELEEQVKYRIQELKNEKLRTEVAVTKALIEGQNMEQRRIAEDLHDGLGQTLTAANLSLHAIESEVAKAGDEGVLHLNNLKELLSNAIREVRSITHNLMPDILEKEGLEAALQELCYRATLTKSIKIDLEMDDLPDDIWSAVELSIYRIIQEIINNTLKHANADKLTIKIKGGTNSLQLVTEDDGIGFNLDKDPKRGGIGIKNIVARVEVLKGRYDIITSEGKGTRFIIKLPVYPEQDNLETENT